MENNDYLEQQNELMEAKRLLLKNQWKYEAKEIPLESLNDSERSLVIRCIKEDTFNDSEINELEQVLGRYREALQKFEPEETLENIEKNVQLIKDEKQFLNLVKEHQNSKILSFYYPVENGNELKIELNIKPITDSSVVEGLSENLQDFQDFTQKEREIIEKQQQTGNLSREEQLIFNNLQKRMRNQSSYTQLYTEAIEFLSKQTSFKGKNSSYEVMKEIYETLDITYVLLLFKQVQTELNLNDVNSERLFRKAD